MSFKREMAEIDFMEGKRVFENLTSESIVSVKLKNPAEQLSFECNAIASKPIKDKCTDEQVKKTKVVVQALYDFAIKVQATARESTAKYTEMLEFWKISKE